MFPEARTHVAFQQGEVLQVIGPQDLVSTRGLQPQRLMEEIIDGGTAPVTGDLPFGPVARVAAVPTGQAARREPVAVAGREDGDPRARLAAGAHDEDLVQHPVNGRAVVPEARAGRVGSHRG